MTVTFFNYFFFVFFIIVIVETLFYVYCGIFPEYKKTKLKLTINENKFVLSKQLNLIYD